MGLLARGTSRAQTRASALLVVGHEDAGQPITSDFIGLSYESAILAAGDYLTPDNRSVLGLIAHESRVRGLPPAASPPSHCALDGRPVGAGDLELACRSRRLVRLPGPVQA
jgi:hypothetical protein